MKRITRLLVVDDDPNILRLFSDILRHDGYETWGVASGEEGLDLVREKRPDLVLLDVGLPHMSGIEVCRQIKADPALSDTLVVLISGAAMSSADRIHGLEAGADDYIVKSTDWNEIRARIRTLMRLRDATAALRASEQHYRRLVEILPDGVSLVDLHGRLTAVNSQAAAMLGYEDPAELIQKSVLDLTPSEEHERVKAQMAEALRNGIIRDAEGLVLRKSGERCPIELSLAVLRDSRNRPFALACVWREITRRKQVEETLRASTERFRQIAESIREVFWITNAGKDEMIYISPGYEAIWGRACKELYASPHTWFDGIHPDDRGRVREAARQKQTAGAYDEVYRIVRPDGSVRWIQDRAFPIRDESGRVYRVVGIAEDITSRKQAEESLRESEARKGAMMQAALDAIVTIDHTGRILEVNFAAEKMFGYPGAALIGRELSADLLPPASQDWFQLGLANSFSGDGGPILGSRIEITALRAHQVEFPAEFSITRIELIGLPMFTTFFRDISARRRTETKLATLVHAIETITETIYMTDLKDRITFVNRAFQSTYGYSEGEVLGKPAALLLHPEIPPALAAEIWTRTQTGGWRGEVLHRRKEGGKFPVALSTSLIRDRAGRVIGHTHVAQDITERRRADERLRLLADAVRSTRDLIFITDARNRFIFVNQAFREAYGYTDEEVLEKSPDLLCSAKTSRELRGEIEQKTADGGWRGEILHVSKDGREFPVSLTTSPIRSADGTILSVVFVARDISDRRRAQEALEESQRLQRAILDNISDPVWLKDPEGRFLAGNEALARFLNLPLEQIVGNSVSDLAAEANQLTRGDTEIIRSRRPARAEEPVRDAQGRDAWFEILKSPIFNSHGRAVGTVGIARNITERKQVEDVLRQLPRRIIEAQEAERLRVARDLHDGVNQIIASVKMRVHHVAESLAQTNPAAREILMRCEKLLVRTIAENRRIAYGLRPSDLDEFGLATACRNFCNELRSRTSLKVEQHISRQGRRLPAAVELNLFRILQESVNNVEKHAGAKILRVRLRFDAKGTTLRIEDDGRGFDAKAPAASRRKRHGIGLTNMQQRAASVGGTLSVVSAPKKGTVVTVTVPINTAA